MQSFAHNFMKLYQSKEELCKVVICDQKGKEEIYSLNKHMFSLVSEFFAEYFKKDVKEKVKVSVTMDVVKDCISFMQFTKSSLSEDKLLECYKLAYEWKCSFLQDECLKCFQKNLDISKALKLVKKYNLIEPDTKEKEIKKEDFPLEGINKIREICAKTICENLNKLQAEDYKIIDYPLINMFLTSTDFYSSNKIKYDIENVLCATVLRWFNIKYPAYPEGAEKDITETNKQFIDCMTNLKFSQLTTDMLCMIYESKQYVKNESLLCVRLLKAFYNIHTRKQTEEETSRKKLFMTEDEIKALKQGDMCDVQDRDRNWYVGKVMKTKPGDIMIHFLGWETKYDEWIYMKDLKRFAPLGTHTNAELHPDVPEPGNPCSCNKCIEKQTCTCMYCVKNRSLKSLHRGGGFIERGPFNLPPQFLQYIGGAPPMMQQPIPPPPATSEELIDFAPEEEYD